MDATRRQGGSHRQLCSVAVLVLLSIEILAFQIPSGAPPPPPPPPPDEQGGVVRLGTKMVLVSFSAINKQGEYVLDLTDQEVEILEDGDKQQILYFRPALINSQQASPALVLLLVDQSKSVESLHLTDARAATQFVGALPSSALVAVASFSEGFTIRQTFTRDREAIENALGSTPRSSDKIGNLFQAVATAVSVLNQIPPLSEGMPNRKILVILSSGFDSGNAVTVEGAVNAANASDVKIYAVEMENTYEKTILSAEDRGPGSIYSRQNGGIFSSSEAINPDRNPTYLSPRGLYEQLATDTGGLFFSATRSANRMEGVLRKIGLQLRSEYVAGYEPNSEDAGGKLRKIEVRIARKGVKTQGARKGYVAGNRAKDERRDPRK